MVFNLTNTDTIAAFRRKTLNADNIAFMNLIIPSISQQIANYIGYSPEIEQHIEEFNVSGYKFKFVTKGYKLHKLVELINDPDRVFTNTAIDSTSYHIRDRGLITVDNEVLSFGTGALKATYYAGIALEAGEFIDILSTPPSTPTSGDVYIVGASPTGVWVGQAKKVATYNGASWDFESQQVKFLVNHPQLVLAATMQCESILQKADKLGANYTALQSHVSTYSANRNFLPEVMSLLDTYIRRVTPND